MLDRRKKAYLKLNIVSILFTVVSMMSVTLAWFAYSGLVNVKTEIGVKAWYIEFEKDDSVVSNDIILSLSDIYPGMESVSELITIKNLGDSDANLSYKINSARILDDDKDYFELNDNNTSEYIEDIISHNYPFHININLSKKHLRPNEGDAIFEVSISWPLDSGDDKTDSYWGNKAYLFEQKEEEKQQQDKDYQKKSSIKVVIDVSAQQSTNDEESVDSDYLLGTKILYDVKKDQLCYEESLSCLKTYVIDTNNKLKDDNVNLIVDPTYDLKSSTYSNYNELYSDLTSTWSVKNNLISAEQVLELISLDLKDTKYNIENETSTIVGKVLFSQRANKILNNVSNKNGYISYNKNNFDYLNNDSCILTKKEYSNDKYYALTNDKFEGVEKTRECKLIPVLNVKKDKLKLVL